MKWYCPCCASALDKIEKDYNPEENSLFENLLVIKKEIFKKLKNKINDDYSEKYSCTNKECIVFSKELFMFSPTAGYKSEPTENSWAIGMISRKENDNV